MGRNKSKAGYSTAENENIENLENDKVTFLRRSIQR